MGIDAEILVRVKGEKPSAAQLKRWSRDICTALGADKFFINAGLPTPEYTKANDAWRKAFNAHKLYPEWARLQVDSWGKGTAVHKQILADLGPAPEQHRDAFELSNARYPIEDSNTSIPVEYRAPGKCYLQDGDPILADHSEWFLEVSLWTRYYGIGYERGDLLFLCAVAEWCEANIPDCEVWYGGDSGGVEAKPWPDSKRRALRKHLYSPAGRDYFKSQGSMSRGDILPPAPCSLCVGEGEFNTYGYGANYSAVHCGGCGKSFETRDSGKTWVLKEKDK